MKRNKNPPYIFFHLLYINIKYTLFIIIISKNI